MFESAGRCRECSTAGTRYNKERCFLRALRFRPLRGGLQLLSGHGLHSHRRKFRETDNRDLPSSPESASRPILCPALREQSTKETSTKESRALPGDPSRELPARRGRARWGPLYKSHENQFIFKSVTGTKCDEPLPARELRRKR